VNVFGIILAFVCYLTLMILIGFRYMKKNENSKDFFLGSRRTGPWVTAFSAEASDMSGWLLMGLPGLAYLGNIKEAFWTAVGLTAGTYLNWLFVAKRLRKYTIHSKNSITIPEFFTNRFHDKSKLISLVSVIFIFIFFTIYTASGFVACAKLFTSVFGLPYIVSLLIGIAVILAYTLLGGYLAVCTTDFVQGSLMFIGLVVSAILVLFALGGPEHAFSAVSKLNEEFGREVVNPFSIGGAGGNFGAMQIVSAIGWGLGYFGMPHILVRFMGLRSNREAAISRRIAMVWVIFAFIGALLIGVLGTAYLMPKVLPANLAETVFIATIMKSYPSFIAGIFLCGILAAAMSTADSQLLVASSAFSNDFYAVFIKRKGADNKSIEKELLLVGRLAVFAVALIGFIIALNPDSSIFRLVSYAWAGFGATFGPVILLSLFWKGISRNGALSGIILGGITVLVWKPLKGGIFDLYEIIPGFIVCLAACVIVSLLDRGKDPELEKEFEAYAKIED